MKLTRKTSHIPFTTACIFFLGFLFFAFDSSAAGTWTLTGSMSTAREEPSTTLLANGKVLVAGGYTGSASSPVSKAEIYNPDNGTWTVTGTMNIGQWAHTATLLPNGKVLVAGGYSNGYNISAEIYNPDNGTWTAAGTMHYYREVPTATVLPNGKVLIVGGGFTAVAEIYDPAYNTWTETGSMRKMRSAFATTLLPNGKVLVAGGHYGSSALADAEIYNPDNGTWGTTGTMNTARELHSATLLPNGRVLVTGGYSSSVDLADAEIYNPDNGTWTVTGAFNNVRNGYTTNLLPNGKVLVAGGVSNSSTILGSTEIYNPDNGTWTVTNTMNTKRFRHAATLLPNGKLLVVGGHDSGSLASAEIYDPAPQGTWTITETMKDIRGANHTATPLPNGKVLVAGGTYSNGSDWVYLNSAEIYNPDNGTWTATGTMNNIRARHTATLLPNGKVLMAGGACSGNRRAPEIYDPELGTWITTADMKHAREDHTATLLSNGKMLVVGGYGETTAEIYNPDNGTWAWAASMNSARFGHTATLLPNGKVLVAGGADGSLYLDSAEIYDPVLNTWTAAGIMHSVRNYHTATLLPNGKVLVAGGYNVSFSVTAATDIYDPSLNTWTEAASMNNGRCSHTATLLPNGNVLVAGGQGGYSSAEIYDPLLNTWTKAASMDSGRYSPAATLLPNGKVLVAGGTFYGPLANAEIYDSNLGFDESWQPIINATSSPNIPIGYPLTLTGSRFRGISQASSGTYHDSSTNYPLVRLTRIDNGQTQWLLPDPANPFSDTSFTSGPLEGIVPGPAMVRVFVNGIPSKAKIIVVVDSYYLNVSKAGLGSGTVISTPEGIDCGSTCSFLFGENTSVTLTATPDTGCAFSGWSGEGCSGTGTCTVTMDDTKNVTATFSCTYNFSSLSVSIPPDVYGGSFEVTTGANCSRVDNSSNWITIPSGLTGSGTVNFTVAQNNGLARSGTITAGSQSFTVYQAARFASSGSGTVEDGLTELEWFTDAALQNKTFNWQEALDAVEALNTANGGEGTYGHNDWRLPTKDELVSLLDTSRTNPALPAGYPFTGVKNTWYWTSSTNLLSPDYAWIVHLGTRDENENYNKTQTAYVWPVRCDNTGAFRTLKVTASGPGSGTVKNMPYDQEQESQNMQNLLCEPVCFNAFPERMTVKLVAYPEKRMSFEGWEGCDNVTSDNACIVLMDQTHDVVANFGDPYGLNKLHKAIIVAGSGPYTENNLWLTTGSLLNDVYDVLLSQGYTDEKITYLTFQTNNVWPEGSDNESGSQKLENAITGWAADADTLVIYMMGHGLTGEFEINGITHEFLQAESLREWLDELQLKKKIPVIVVYEGCYSGSFVPLLAPGAGLEDVERIVITSAGSDEKAWFAVLGDVSFSEYFWSAVQDGETVDVCFAQGKQGMQEPGYQTAQMDANGDNKTDSNDETLASQYIIGRGNVNAALVPKIGTITGEQRLHSETSARVTITISAGSPTPELVWAVIRRPSDGAQTDPRAITDLLVETVSSTGCSPDCFYDYEYTASGVYTVAAYALAEGKISMPKVTKVIRDVDAYEEDDTSDQAKPVVVNSGVPQYHNFWNDDDIDWVKFYGMPGKAGSQLYNIKVFDLGSKCDAEAKLYGPDDAKSLITYIDIDNGTDWLCTTAGMYYVKIYQASGTNYGDFTNYHLKVWNPDAPVLGLIKGSIKDTGGSAVPSAVITTDGGYSALGSNGAYEMPHAGGGPFTLKAEAAGYEQYSQPGINLAERGTLQLNIVMTPIGGGTTTTVPGGDDETTTTTTTTGGGSTTTTTTIRRLCPARKALGDGSEAELEGLRVFRDARLAKSAEGARLVSMYYRHAGELTAMFERRPEIAAQVRELVLELLPQLGGQQKLVLSQDMKGQIYSLIDELRAEASPGLKKSLRQVRKTIEKGELPGGPPAVLQ